MRTSAAAIITCLLGSVPLTAQATPPQNAQWPPATPAGQRTIAVVNNCKTASGDLKPIWVAVIPQTNSWNGKLLDGSTPKSYFTVPDDWAAARVWARTDCTGSGADLTCKTGDCNGQFSCTVSGSGAVNVVEMSLGQPGNVDYYDLSNIDGYNVPTAISKLRGTGACPPLTCTLDPTTFPGELQYQVSSNTYLYNITGAMNDTDFRQTKPYLNNMYNGWAAQGGDVLETKMAQLSCAPGTCGYPGLTGTEQGKYTNFPHCTQELSYVVLAGNPPGGLPAGTTIYTDEVPPQCSSGNPPDGCPAGFYCQAQSNSPTGVCASCCGCWNPASVAACCPEEPGRNLPPNKRCSLPPVHGGVCTVDNIPVSSTGEPYYEIFHTACPDSYSWQFDDENSLASCTSDSSAPNDYLITFCPPTSKVPPTL